MAGSKVREASKSRFTAAPQARLKAARKSQRLGNAPKPRPAPPSRPRRVPRPVHSQKPKPLSTPLLQR